MKQNRKNTLLAVGFTALALSMTGCANDKHQVELGEKYKLKTEDFGEKKQAEEKKKKEEEAQTTKTYSQFMHMPM